LEILDMKKLLLVSSALVFAGPVMAADLPPAPMPMKALPPVAAVPYSWTGCSVGGNVGAGWDHTTFSDPGLPNFIFGNIQTIAPAGSVISEHGGAGVVGGVQAGCDYQFSNHWVIGIGGDYGWSNINGALNDPFFVGKNNAPVQLNTQTDRIASVTGRVGYAWDHFLLYGKGGGAWVHDNDSVQNAPCFIVSCGNLVGSTDRNGWTAGVGLEWAFATNWSALIEYDHYGFNSKGVTLVSPQTAPLGLTYNIKQDVDIVKVGINYRFGFGGPLVARY
jgi:outer membrane immunogenic protein